MEFVEAGLDAAPPINCRQVDRAHERSESPSKVKTARGARSEISDAGQDRMPNVAGSRS
jgi:hypothetical protein